MAMRKSEKGLGLSCKIFTDVSHTNEPRRKNVNQRRTGTVRDNCTVSLQLISDLWVNYVILT